MMAIQLTRDDTVDGFHVMNGPFRLATVTTGSHDGTIKEGRKVYGLLPKNDWGVHLCSARVSLTELAALGAFLNQQTK